jgi:Protein of unknown function (DUF2798)
VEGKAKYIFPLYLSGVMSFLMTGFVTWLNLGLPPDFLMLWMRAWVKTWPLAYIAALIAAPIARRLTGWTVKKLEGRS